MTKSELIGWAESLVYRVKDGDKTDLVKAVDDFVDKLYWDSTDIKDDLDEFRNFK